MATLQELELALVNADRAGDLDAARRLAAVLVKARQDVKNHIPDSTVPGTTPEYVEPTVGEKTVGAGETALTLATGATGGTVGMIGGTLKGLAEQILSGKFGTPEAAKLVEQEAMKGAQALTYAPRTEAGQEMARETGQFLAETIPPVIPVIGPIGAVANSTKMAAPVVAATAGRVAAPVVAATKRAGQAVAKVAEPITETMPGAAKRPSPKFSEELHHGTSHAFDDYDPAKVGSTTDAGFYGVGMSMTPSKAVAQNYAEFSSSQTGLPGRVITKRVNLYNPLVTERGALAFSDAFQRATGKRFSSPAEATKVLQDLGFDGVVVKKPDGTTSEVTVFAKTPTPGTPASGGAAGVDMATLRQAKADELPVPIKLTEGQKTRQFEDVRFERETAKLPEVGEPLRERFAQQNQQLRQNLDAFIDMTGAQAGESEFRRATGMAVNEALRSRAARDKARIRVLYKEAEKAGELASPANLSPIADYLNQNRAGRSSAPIMGTFAEELKVQGVGSGSLADGTLQIGEVSLGQAEALRKAINRFVKSNDPNDVRVASELKQLIDTQTEGLGGNLYQQARAARARYAADYENIGLVKNLLGFKRGTTDRAIALEEVLNRSIIDPGTSLDTVRQIRRLLQTEGPKGMQAWKELQGGTLQYIKEEALRNVAPDQFGNRIVSPAQLDRVITQLDKTGKLDFVFGKKGAEQLRTINDVAKDVLTVPPGTVNTSNTASVLAGLMDVAISGTSGVPAPVMTSFRLMTKGIKDAKTRARVKRALGE